MDNEKEIDEVRSFLRLIGSIELTWLEAGVLLHSFFNGFDLWKTADIFNVHVSKVEAAEKAIILKVAVALGYVTAEDVGIDIRLVEDALFKRREQVKRLYESGLRQVDIYKKLNIPRHTLRDDLRAMGLK